MTILICNKVAYKYPGSSEYAIKDINCSFQHASITSIVGESGSGKSTLLSLLAGLDIPTEGEIFYDKIPLGAINPDLYRREKVSMIFQDFNLFPLLTVIENACVPQLLLGADRTSAKKTAKTLLQSVGISEDKFHRYPSNLSGGEQQRVAIARALSSGAKILLADEPTGNLDKDNSYKVINILTKLAHELGYCVVLVTHDCEISRKTDKIYRMRSGKLLDD